MILDELSVIFGVDNGFEHLRSLVLELAVKGCLVSQEPSDESADSMLDRLRLQRDEFLRRDAQQNNESQTILKKLKKLPKASEPYQIPSTWSWANLLDTSDRVVDCHNKTAPYTPSGIPLIRTANVKRGKIVLEDLRYVSEETAEFWSRRCTPRPGDLIFTREAPLGEAAIIPPDMKVCLGQRTMLVRPMNDFVLGSYLLIALLEPGVLRRAAVTAIGSTVKHLRVRDVESLPIAVPPLPEQKRIVAKVEELTDLCNRLEKAHQTRNKLRDDFTASALDNLTQAQTPDQLKPAWSIIKNNFPTITATADSIRKLRQTILQLAVQGKLVPQDPSDGTAEALYRSIQATLRRKTRECADNHSLPGSWVYVTLGDITNIGTGSTPSRTTPSFWNGSIPWVKSGATSQPVINEADEFITDDAVNAHRLKIYKPGTLLVALYGQGKTRGQVAILGIHAAVNQACAAIVPVAICGVRRDSSLCKGSTGKKL